MSIAPPTFFCSPLSQNSFFLAITQSVCIASYEVVFLQAVYSCMHSTSFCLFIAAFSPFMFKVVVDKYLVTIYYIVCEFVFIKLFSFLSNEDPSAFPEVLVWWF